MKRHKIANIVNVSVGCSVLYKEKYTGLVVSKYKKHATVYLARNRYVDMNVRNLHHFELI